MHPSDSLFLDRLEASSIRYVIPVYQRMYSWDRDHVEQLWHDIVAVGQSEGGKHFTGSIVWVQDGGMTGSGEIDALLIDGQQRMTTLSLLLIALAAYGKKNSGKSLEYRWKKVVNSYLLHDEYEDPGRPRRYKLTLSDEDNDTFHSLIDELTDDSVDAIRTSDKIYANYKLLLSMIESIADPNVVWRGVRKLQVISVSLDQGADNPQAIFESMNSTGKDLSAADLVRNYVLMGLPVKEQNKLYKNYWRPIERYVGSENRDERFDEFLKDYLTVVCSPEPINLKDVYAVFKRRVVSNDWYGVEQIESLLGEMKRYAEYYSRIALGGDKDKELAASFSNIVRFGVTVVNPVLMEFLDACDGSRQRISKDELDELLHVMESYLVRRAVCDCATNSLNKYFASLIAKLRSLEDDVDYTGAVRALISLEAGTARRYPDDAEFAGMLRTRNFYGFRKALYLLNRLENSYHAKNNPVDFSTGQYSIEHIMPQNALAHEEWVEMLGGTGVAEEAHAELLHNLGNLTVTAYNSELSDGLFSEKKKRMDGGFDHDVISLSDDCKAEDGWNRQAIEKRAKRLVERACAVWPLLSADEGLVEKLGRKSKKVAGVGESVTLKKLFDAGFITAGAILFHDGEAGREEAKVLEGGRIGIQNGEIFDSPSMAAMRCVVLRTGTKRSRNGWKYWRVAGGDGVLLDDLRAKYRAENGIDDDMDDWNTWHIAFWEGFYELCSSKPDFCEVFGDLSERKPNRGYFADLSCGTPGRHITVNVLTSKKNLGVVCGEWFDAVEDYAPFYEKRDEIVDSIEPEGAEWKWDDLDAQKKSRCPFLHKRIDVNDEELRVEAYDWLVRTVWAFKKAFE